MEYILKTIHGGHAHRVDIPEGCRGARQMAAALLVAIDKGVTEFSEMDFTGLTLRRADIAEFAPRLLDHVWTPPGQIGASSDEARIPELSGLFFHRALFHGVTVDGVALKSAHLVRAKFVNSRVEGFALTECDLTDAFFINTRLVHTEWSGCTAHGIVFRRAEIYGSTIRNSSLYDGDFALSDVNCHFQDCDLNAVIFSSSDLANAVFTNSTYGGMIRLKGERPFFQIGPIGSRRAQLTFIMTDAGIFVRTGCFFGTLEQFREAVAARHIDEHAFRKEYENAIGAAELHFMSWP